MENHNGHEHGEKCEQCDSMLCKGCHAMHGAMQSWCGWCHGGKHRILKILIVIAVFIVVFWTGFKLGELAGIVKSEWYGYPMGGWSAGRSMMGEWSSNGYGPGMMRFWYGTSTPER